MKLEIVTGQSDINIDDFFTGLLKQNNIDVEDLEQKHYLIYPERKIYHPKKLYDTIRKIVREHIELNSDMFILTYSDHVLNAVRVEIKNHNYEGGKCHQILNSGDDICADITNKGGLTRWANDIFDVWEKALIDLI